MEWGWIVVRYAMESVKYTLAYQFFYKKEQRFWIVCLGLLPSLCLNFVPGQGDAFVRVFIYFFMLFFIFLSVKEKASVKMRKIAKILLFYLIVDVVVEVPGKIMQIMTDTALDENVCYLWESGACILGLSLLFVIRRSLNEHTRDRISLWLKKSMMGIVFFMILEMLITISVLSVAAWYIEDMVIQVFFVILRGLAVLSVGFLSVLLFYLRKTNKQLLMMKQQETQMRELQKKYYELQLKKEEDTRKYRHDQHHHLMCLRALSEKAEYDKLQNYLADMQQDMSEIQGRTYMTGNTIIDIITNAYLSELDDSVHIKFQSYFNEPVQIREEILCTVYGNLVENAVEELKKGSADKEYRLQIQLNCGKEYFRLVIENSLTEEDTGRKAGQTWKENPKQHGFGLQNVRRAVEEQKGEMTIEKEENLYRVTVLLSNNATV